MLSSLLLLLPFPIASLISMLQSSFLYSWLFALFGAPDLIQCDLCDHEFVTSHNSLIEAMQHAAIILLFPKSDTWHNHGNIFIQSCLCSGFNLYSSSESRPIAVCLYGHHQVMLIAWCFITLLLIFNSYYFRFLFGDIPWAWRKCCKYIIFR